MIFGFIFGSASSDGEVTGDVQEDFGGNTCCSGVTK